MNIDIDHLTRRFGRTQAVAGVDLQVGPGVFGLLGPNGAGKTSLLRMMATVLQPSSGSLQLLGRDPSESTASVARSAADWATCLRTSAITRVSRSWSSSSTSRS